MRIGIMSDSHDHMDNVRQAVGLFNESAVEHVLHAGDFVAPFVLPELGKLNCGMTGVFGNNDGERLGLRTVSEGIGEIIVQPAMIELGGRNLVMVHEPEPVDALAASGKFDLVVYGHLHQRDLRHVNETLIINPGETCNWVSGEPSIVLLDLETMDAQILELKGK